MLILRPETPNMLTMLKLINNKRLTQLVAVHVVRASLRVQTRGLRN